MEATTAHGGLRGNGCEYSAGDASGFSVEVASSFVGCSVTAAAWDELVDRLGGPVYLTYDWLKTWWEFYGRDRELRLFVFKSRAEVIGLIPVYIDSVGIWPINYRIARIVGANIPPKVFDPPVKSDCAVQCFVHLVRCLLLQDKCDLLSFGPLSSTSASWSHFPQIERAISTLGRMEDGPKGVHSIFRLPARMEEYLDSFCKNEQKNRRKYELRALRKEYPVRVDVLSSGEEELSREFERFARQHSLQWQAEGKPGHFGAWPNALSYNRALVKCQGRLGRMRFIRIWAGEEVIANQYTFAFAGRWFWELPSRSVGPSWDRFSLGPSGIVTMIGEAIKENVHTLEGGLGHYAYKLRLNAQEHPTCTFRVVARGFSTSVRKLIFDAIRKCLLVGYHKIWYRRVMPLLPLNLPKTQRMLWLRFDY